MWKEFREFIARGNVVDLAVAVIIGAAFGRIVTALVGGIIMPPIGLLLGGVDFVSLFYVLDDSAGIPASLVEATERGIAVIAYGAFINEIVNFLIIGFVIFLVVKSVNRLKRGSEETTTRDCPECLSSIPIGATRCAYCTVEVKA